MSSRSERRWRLWRDVVTSFRHDPLINWTQRLWGTLSSWFEEADRARPGRSAVRSLRFDHLESRRLLSSDVGLTGFNAATGAWTVSRYDGTQYTVESAPSWTSSSNLQNVQTVDLWGRGYSDLIGYDSSTGTWWGTWNVGTGITTAPIAGWAAGEDFQNIVTGDFNQDGRTDFAGWDPVRGQLVAATSMASGFASQIVAVWSPTDKWEDITAGDFNHDGYTDIIGFDATTGAWHMVAGSPTGLTNDQVIGQWDPTQNWQDLTTGAFYHDGNTDILGYNATTGDWHTLAFNGSSFQDRIIGNWNPAENWQIAGVGDFWGIGQGMLLGFDPATGEWRGTWAIGSGT
ncbi:MAG TPA: VCBS repeat-containing protein, partial [Planctomycetaceae bacterium]|nr:VCBS repeat-containing protein [Planctomycetaceae bacterium]